MSALITNQKAKSDVRIETKPLSKNNKQAKKRARNLKIAIRSLELVGLFLAVSFIVWIFASYFNVISNNLTAEGAKSIWSFNFFKVFVKTVI